MKNCRGQDVFVIADAFGREDVREAVMVAKRAFGSEVKPKCRRRRLGR